MFTQKNYNNIKVQQIDSQEKLLTKIDINSNKILLIILDIWNIYTKYFNKLNEINKQCN